MTVTEAETLLSTVLDTEIFAGISQEEQEKILSYPEVKRITLQKGQYIYHHGDKSESFWIIVSGEIVAQVQSLRHPFHSVRYIPGDITGLRGVVDIGKPRPVSMVADSELVLIEIPGEIIKSLDSSVYAAIMSNIARILLDRLLECHNQMDR